MSQALALLIGVLLDKRFGDPSPHPIVYFGKLISACEQRFNQGSHRQLAGSLVAVALIAGTYCLTWVTLAILPVWLGWLLTVAGVFYLLAYRSLMLACQQVFTTLTEQGLAPARVKLSWIVGRQTEQLDAQAVRTAALETLAENLSDGVIAPLFWFTLLGLPGMAAYKMINTLDSMVGYKSERYRAFGWASARIDDWANWLPARLSAMLIAGFNRRAWRYIRRYGRAHASPNAGYPEAALAGRLDCQFGGSHQYFGQTIVKPFIGEHATALNDESIKNAIQACRNTYLLSILASVLVLLAY